MLRNSNNTARKLATADAKYRGLHLVWSRDRQQAPVIAIRRTARKSRPPLGLAIAAALGPAVWLGHAVLRWMKAI